MRLKQQRPREKRLTYSIVAFAMSISSCEYAPHDASKVAEGDTLPPIDTVAAITNPHHLESSPVKKDSAEYAKIHSYDDYPDPILDSLKRAAEKLRTGQPK